MKYFFVASLTLAILGSLGAHSSDVTYARTAAPMTASQLAKALAKAGLPVTTIVAATAASDANRLLGRPGYYTSKADFEDGRWLVSASEIEATGNTIEVFATEGDAIRRQAYVTRVTRSMPMFAQYIYRRKTILLRLKGAMLPDEAKAYEAALAKIAP
jgi:hypothetical protein